MWVRQVCRQVTPAGSSSVSSTASVLTGSSWTILRDPTLVKTHSTLSSTLGALGVMFPEPYTSTWSPQWLVSSHMFIFYPPYLRCFLLLQLPSSYCVWPHVWVHLNPHGSCRLLQRRTRVSRQQDQRWLLLPFIQHWLTFTEVEYRMDFSFQYDL